MLLDVVRCWVFDTLEVTIKSRSLSRCRRMIDGIWTFGQAPYFSNVFARESGVFLSSEISRKWNLVDLNDRLGFSFGVPDSKADSAYVRER